jgi:hypothetical protein
MDYIFVITINYMFARGFAVKPTSTLGELVGPITYIRPPIVRIGESPLLSKKQKHRGRGS